MIREGGGCKKKLVDSCRGKEEFYEKKKTLYQISEFGKYFFEKLLQENSNIKYFSDSIGDIS